MFTLADICNIAIQIEQNGEAAYRRASANSRNGEVADFFSLMADEEKRHAAWFANLCNKVNIPAKDQQIEKMGRELLQKMMAHQTFSMDSEKLAESNNIEEALSQSIEFENDTILFYEMLHSFLEDTETMAHLETVINEEQSHIERLKQIAGMLAAENQIS